MVIAVDFDRTIVQDSPYDTVTSLRLVSGAKEALLSLKEAGHQLILWSARANKALLYNPTLDPLVRAGVKKANVKQWKKERPVHLERYRQMLEFVAHELPDVFDAIDDGSSGKPIVDKFIDDKAVCLGGMGGVTWQDIASEYGVPSYLKDARRRAG